LIIENKEVVMVDFDKAFVNSDLGIGELSPGSTPRRWVPEGGENELKKRISRDSKRDDNLPFKFSKPPKSTARKKLAKCCNCGSIKYVGINCTGVICNECNAFSAVEDIE